MRTILDGCEVVVMDGNRIRSYTSENLENLSREAYALLRYKQALSGSSDGSQLGAILAMGGNVQGNKAKKVYHSALKDFDKRNNQE